MLKNIGADYGKVSFFISLISIVCLIVYALWDANYRVEAYAEIRKDYYKKLKRDEEELLDVLCGIRQSLEKNIDIMVKNKRVLLEEGAYALSGKRCSIDGNTITIIEEFQYGFIDGCFEFVNELDDCNDLFNRLGEIYADMVKCGLLNADIYNLKDDIPLLLQMKFWGINKNDFKSEQLRCFSKNSMIKWCHNWFEEYLVTEKYPWRKVKERIIDASIILDYVLLDSLELELYLEECIKTIIAGFSKENIFYRLKIGK